MLGKDREYFSRRVREEVSASEVASSPEARKVHRELADLYSARLNLVEAIASGRVHSFASSGISADCGAAGLSMLPKHSRNRAA